MLASETYMIDGRLYITYISLYAAQIACNGHILYLITCNNKYSNNIIHLVVCLTTGPKPLPKPALHTVRSRASSFN